MPWRHLEQKGAIRFLLYLLEHGECNVTQIFDDVRNASDDNLGQSASYRAIDFLLNGGFIEEKRETDYGPRVIVLTEKGRTVAGKLKELETIMRDL